MFGTEKLIDFELISSLTYTNRIFLGLELLIITPFLVSWVVLIALWCWKIPPSAQRKLKIRNALYLAIRIVIFILFAMMIIVAVSFSFLNLLLGLGVIVVTWILCLLHWLRVMPERYSMEMIELQSDSDTDSDSSDSSISSGNC